MTTYAVVDQSTGIIINRIVLDEGSEWQPEENHAIVEETDGALEIGATYIDGVYTPLPKPPEPPVPVPASISDRQFFQQLAIVGTITQADALAAVKVGTIPAALQGFVDAITDPAEKFAANMLLAGATVFERNHPLTDAIGAAQGMTPDQVDDFFRAAAVL